MSNASCVWSLLFLLAGCGDTFSVSLGSNAEVAPDGGDTTDDPDAGQAEPSDANEVEDDESEQEEQEHEEEGDEPGEEEREP